jgi:RNA polymerase sigma-70 factor (ECF subfamily)
LTTEPQNARPAAVESAAARDAELIRRILGGERELFHELVRPYEKSVYYATFSILQNQQDAEDAAQETVLKALKNLHSFRAESKFSTWLISIAVNEARARLRHDRVLKFESVDQSQTEEDGSFTPAVITDWREVPLQALERKELREQLQKAIASLPEIYREVLLLRDVEEFDIAETAAALGVSTGVVKTRLLRARLMMQKILTPQLRSKKSGLFGLFRSKAGGSWF